MSAARDKLRAVSGEGLRTAARSGLYSMLARALAVPDEQLYAALKDDSLAKAIAEAASELPYALAAPEPAVAPLPAFEEFQADYLAAFELGTKGPPCPLYEGAFRPDRGRKSIMEELLRFYHHFGLEMSRRVRELPDQLGAELEFMHYLAFLETRLIQERGQARLDLIRAQRDFLDRHLAAWTPELAGKAAKKGAPGFYLALLSFLNIFVSSDLAYLEELLAQ